MATKKVSAPKAAAASKPKRTKSAAPVPDPVVAEPVTGLAESVAVEAPVQIAPATPPAPTRDDVARRAYEIFLARGGAAFDNWTEAERQLRARS